MTRAISAPRERRVRPDPSAVQGPNHDLESKQFWLAAEEKRIKDEAVRLAGLAASLERETERLERQRLQAEKLEREMRERFGALDNRSDRQSPRSEGTVDRWAAVDAPGAVGTLRQLSKRAGTKEEATSPSSDAHPVSLPGARSQPGSRAPSRPRSRSSKKGDERASRSAKGDDSSSSGTARSNRSARAARRKKYERSKSTGRIRTSELGRNAVGKRPVDAWGFSGDELGPTRAREKLDLERNGTERNGIDQDGAERSKTERHGTGRPELDRALEEERRVLKLGVHGKSLPSTRDISPGGGRPEGDSLEALYRAVAGGNPGSPGARANDNGKESVTKPGIRNLSYGDVAAPEGATSPSSSLSSQSGSLTGGNRKRVEKKAGKESARRGASARVESAPARARVADWLETDAETDMEEVRRKMRRKEMQELAELEEFEEIEKTVMDL